MNNKTGSTALIGIILIISASLIAMAISQGQSISQYHTYNLTNPEGVNIPQNNITDGLLLPIENLTGNIIIPAGNITNETHFPSSNFTFDGNVSVLAENKLCLNAGCTRFIWDNGTHIIVNNTG